MVRGVLYSVLMAVILMGCSVRNHDNESIFELKGSYIGDASAVGKIVGYLPKSELFEGMELKTTDKPYGMILNYKDTNMNEDSMKETALYNASYIFTLFRNADWIEFRFGEKSMTVTKGKLEEWYRAELYKYENEEDLQKLIQKHLDDEEKVKQFMK
ncbi:DUF4825 domain-containing protein [Bacillus niameyensis]|uniref:DUF4825 domain-containing protein n=1 Tax=Bacillus niameyensis TaxID=1522308 RepID=UPI000784168F|nr:DUF4825 domain-containing protein [Bacillus niameyensis]